MARIGYWALEAGRAEAFQVDEIETAGHEAVALTDLTSASLSAVDVIYLLNESNDAANLTEDQEAALDAAVFEYGVSLMYFDRHVTSAPRVLPGGDDLAARRNFGDDERVDLAVDVPFAFTEAGTDPLTDESFDDGNSSSHGFVQEASLPLDGIPLLTRDVDDQLVAFTYGHGAGSVLYSTIPLDFYSVEDSGAITAAEVADLIAGSVAVLGEGIEVVEGTEGADDLTGTAEVDRILGLGGDDTITGLGAGDILSGGDGADDLRGGDGNDRLLGDAGDDTLDGGAGDDRLTGHDGNDSLDGGAGGDALTGGAGADLLSGGEDDDNLTGDAGADTLSGDAGNDTLRGEADDDLLTGGDGADEVYGGDGADDASGGAGADLIRGDDGADTLRGDAGDDTLLGDDGDDLVTGGAGDDALQGGAGGDTVDGGDGNDIVEGNGGADSLTGGAGDDTLIGGEGADTMDGGAGSDTYFVDDLGDVVIEDVDAEGTDTLFSTRDIFLGDEALAAFENAGVFGSGRARVIGDDGDNVLTGNSNNNILDGRKGADTMQGERGNDVYFYRQAEDILVEERFEGRDLVKATISHKLGAHFEVLFLQADEAPGDPVRGTMNGIGNRGDNYIVGNNDDNVLIGREGNDVLRGQGGADTFVFDRALGDRNVDRIVDFESGVDTLKLKASAFGLAEAPEAGFLALGDAATDGADRFVYDGTTLSFDADGSGAGAAVAVMTFTNGVTLTEADFVFF